MLKFALIYGWLVILIMASIIITMMRGMRGPMMTATCIRVDGAIRCVVRLSRARPGAYVYCITMPAEFAHRIGAAPPPGFRLDATIRGEVFWRGRVELPPDRDVELLIPVSNPKAEAGTMQLHYQRLGSLGVGILMTWVQVTVA